MDFYTVCIRLVSFTITVVVFLSLNILDIANGNDIQLSQLRLFAIKKSEPPLYQKRDTSSAATPTPLIQRKKEENTRSASLALSYIVSTLTNRTRAQLECSDSGNEPLTLDEYNLQYSKSYFHDFFTLQAGKAVDVANGLTSLHFNEKSVDIRDLNDSHVSVYTAILKYYVQNDSHITGSGIAFENGFFPYVSKSISGSAFPSNLGAINPTYKQVDYYTMLKARNYSKLWKTEGVSKVTAENHTAYIGKHEGFWTAPYYDCRNQEKWIITYSVPFFRLVQDQPAFGGVVTVDIDLDSRDVNQCVTDEGLFSYSDKCPPETTQCEHQPGHGLALGSYVCVCRDGFYFPNTSTSGQFYSGSLLESVYLENINNGTNFTGEGFQCVPCLRGCTQCVDSTPCMAEYNILLRGIPLGIQSFCITVTLVIAVAVIRLRKTKVMVSGMWTLLEIILIGAVLLYATVIMQYFKPTATICLVIPWFRELGFAIVYGALVLKVYRLLAEFQSRKAHRVHVRDKDLLKYLLCVVVVVLGYMSAWTTVTLDHLREGKTLLEMGSTPGEGLKYPVCKAGWWDYVIEIAELMFLCFGIYLCYKVRAAPSDYSEGTYISAAICYEAVVSCIFYVLRHVYWLNLHPDYLFLMYFVRCQMTVTVTLLLIYGPKLLYAHRPPENHHLRNRAYSSSDGPDNMGPESMKLNIGVSSNGDVDVGEISLADMDPEDIRAELKRLYTQLQIYKTRTMRKENRHISKRRGGRKQTHRRFSLQPFHHKHRHHHDHDHEHEMSKTPEESTNSAEGVPMGFDSGTGNKCDDVHENEQKSSGQCTVTFKMGHK
ncbi:metabotropic glycine receptor-like [Argopecten irradians]|uniref:metabotropic glycine receptor-like n=1 Tax=Argopecten irradians TaxID=31199 RepID=UPI003722BFE4